MTNMKKQINQNILNCIKNSAIDCKIYNKKGTDKYAQCFTIDDDDSEYLYKPSVLNDDTDSLDKTTSEKNPES